MVRFLDEAVITVQSGNGGRGCISFRRERFIPRGGPDGGDGGDGGSVYIRASPHCYTLADFISKRHFRARNGMPGEGKNKTGKNGSDVVIEVPPGTVVIEEETGHIIADLILSDQQVLIAAGGKGGKGNKHFATSTNRAPRRSQPGLPGRTLKVMLSLKHLADVGLIGLPNAGKSTLLSTLTTADPRIGDYPFTTLTPNLGVIPYDDGGILTVADIPGLIEGASRGKGLGHRFLKHIERTRILLHIIDLTRPVVENGILEDFSSLLLELGRYDSTLMEKEQVVLLNKKDVHQPGVHRDIARMRLELEGKGFESLVISALTGDGLEDLKTLLGDKLLAPDPRRQNCSVDRETNGD
jgi:GTP-binding protein